MKNAVAARVDGAWTLIAVTRHETHAVNLAEGYTDSFVFNGEREDVVFRKGEAQTQTAQMLGVILMALLIRFRTEF